MEQQGGGGSGHTPGRGHQRKSDRPKRKRFQRKAARKKQQAQKGYDDAVKRWEALTEEQRKLLPELHPDNFKP
jgi:hypothetical protein